MGASRFSPFSPMTTTCRACGETWEVLDTSTWPPKWVCDPHECSASRLRRFWTLTVHGYAVAAKESVLYALYKLRTGKTDADCERDRQEIVARLRDCLQPTGGDE